MTPLPRRLLKLSAAPFLIAQMIWRARSYAMRWDGAEPVDAVGGEDNPLLDYFRAHRTGRGIWKWEHYFEIYQRHFSRFRNQEVHVLEIGVYSGGSLEMWQQYFGPRCKVYGVDIEPSCRAYENENVKILIGDQQDRSFWKTVRQQVPALDIVIDDGGHTPEQQIVTLEETLPHLRPGGVFLCEDVCGALNRFATYVSGLALQLNSFDPTFDENNNDRRNVSAPSVFQKSIHSVHAYPFVTVLEKRREKLDEFIAPKHGSTFEPFLK